MDNCVFYTKVIEKVVVIMLEEIQIIMALVLIIISIVLVFNARNLIKKKTDGKFENTKVLVIKIIGLVICVIGLGILYYIKHM